MTSLSEDGEVEAGMAFDVNDSMLGHAIEVAEVEAAESEQKHGFHVVRIAARYLGKPGGSSAIILLRDRHAG